MSEPITEYRKDGWPICPVCEEDEVMSYLAPDYVTKHYDEHGTNPPIEDYLAARLYCLVCGWEQLPSTDSGGSR